MTRKFAKVCFLLAACCGPAARGDEPAQVFVDNGELNYIGYLSTEANHRAFELLAAQPGKPTVLNIRSKGGPTDAGMELGKWVRQEGLSIKVVEYCFSSCANYVFTAARMKTVSNFAIVGYHGGLSSSQFDFAPEQEAVFAALPAEQQGAARKQFMDELAVGLAPQRKAEREFFDSIGVQQSITTLGQTPYYKKRYDQTNAIGWSFSVADFAKLGVANVTVINPPWKPRSLSSASFVYIVDLRKQ